MAASLLSDAAAFALRVAFDRAMQRHAPAFSVHGPTAAPNRGVLVDTVIGFLRIALWAAFLVVVLAVLLLVLVLFASCAVAATAVYLDRAGPSRSRNRRLVLLSFVSLFLLTLAVALMVVVIFAVADGEE